MEVSFPGLIEYISPVRKLVSNVLLMHNFSQRCAFNSEIIVDEACSNALVLGSQQSNGTIRLVLVVCSDRIEFRISSEESDRSSIERLSMALRSPKETIRTRIHESLLSNKPVASMELVSLLSERLELNVFDDNSLSLLIVRKAERS